MAIQTVPSTLPGDCSSLRIEGQFELAQSEVDEVREILALVSEDDLHFAVGRTAGSRSKNVGLAEAFGLDVFDVTDTEGVLTAPKGTAGLLHFSVRLLASESPLEELNSSDNRAGRLWDWIGERRKNASCEVSAFSSPDVNEFAAIAPLPLDLPPQAVGHFTAASGITLVKLEEGSADKILYRVHVERHGSHYHVVTTFTAPIAGDAEFVKRILQRAFDIMSFALQRKADVEVERDA